MGTQDQWVCLLQSEQYYAPRQPMSFKSSVSPSKIKMNIRIMGIIVLNTPILYDDDDDETDNKELR